MAVNEISGFLKYKDSAGDVNLLLPITTKDNVDGLDEIENELANAVKVTEQNLTDEQKAQARENIGAVSTWEELPDKPFGEIDNTSDVLTWDGNTEGLYSFEERGIAYYRVSDAILTLADFENASTIVYTDEQGRHCWHIEAGDNIATDEMLALARDDVVMITATDCISNITYDGIYCYPNGKEHPAGVYFAKSTKTDWSVVVNSLRINNCNKFPTFKNLDSDNLHEALHFGDIPCSNSITWNGVNGDRLVVSDGYFIKVSDVIVTEEDLQGEVMLETHPDPDDPAFICTFTIGDGATYIGEPDWSDFTGAIAVKCYDFYGNPYDAIILVPDGCVYPSGVYFRTTPESDNFGKTVSLTIVGFKKFPVAKSIDQKYLPKALQFGETSHGSDTFTWDGNVDDGYTIISDPDYIDLMGNQFHMTTTAYKISDDTPTMADLENVIEIYYHIDLYQKDSSDQRIMDTQRLEGIPVSREDGTIVVLAMDENGNSHSNGDIYIFPDGSQYPKGMYSCFYHRDDATCYDHEYMSSLTIPGYGKFPVTKPIETKYLPKHLQFGEIPGGSDTLTWDGQHNGQYNVICDNDYCDPNGNTDSTLKSIHRVYDNVLTENDLVNGVEVHIYSLYEGEDVSYTAYPSFDNGYIQMRDNGVIAIMAGDPDNMPYPSPIDTIYIYPEGSQYRAGVYFGFNNGEQIGVEYVSSLTIPGYGKFPIIKKIDPKYLPDNIGGGSAPNVGPTPIVTSGDGAEYTATIEGVTELYNGLQFVMLPHTNSTTTSVKLNVNGLGAKVIRQRLSTNTSIGVVGATDNWIVANKPITVTYNGTAWMVELVRPDANNLYGTVKVENGGLPSFADAAEGSVLRIVNGVPTWVLIPDAEGGSF